MVSLTITTSGIVDGQVGDAVDFTTPLNELKVHIQNALNGVQAFDAVTVGIAEALTIAAGVVTATKTHIVVDTEASAATDELDTINSPAEGKIIFLRIANAARTVRVKHNTGNIRTWNGKHLLVDTDNAVVQLTGTASVWIASVVLSNTISLGNNTSSTLASDVFTRSMSVHKLTPETGTYDELTNIAGAVAQENDLLVISPVTGAAVKVKSRNLINLADGRERVLYGSNALMLLNKDGSWVDVIPTNHLMPRPGFNNWWREKAAAATYEPMGMASGTNAGAGAVTNSNGDDGTFVSQAIAATTGTFGGRRSTTYNLVRVKHDPRFTAVIRTGSDVTNLRIWVGLFSAMVTNVDTIAGATEAAAFRFSTVAADVNWKGICKDATTQSAASDTGVAVAADTKYKLSLWVLSDTGAVYFSVNDRPATFVITNLPANATDLGFVVTAVTTTNTAKALAISDIYCEYTA